MKENYKALVAQIKHKMTQKHFMFVIGEHRRDYTKSDKLNKATFKKYITQRYGATIAEKWHNVIDLTTPLDFE